MIAVQLPSTIRKAEGNRVRKTGSPQSTFLGKGTLTPVFPLPRRRCDDVKMKSGEPKPALCGLLLAGCGLRLYSYSLGCNVTPRLLVEGRMQ